MPYAIATILWPVNISWGTIGIGAYFHSQVTNAAISRTPMIRLQST